MRDFSVFIADGSIKQQHPDSNLSESLAKDCLERFEDAKLSMKTERKPKFIYENVYEALREAADSILFLKGYKSFSHEASISFLQQFKELSSKEISDFDRMRVKRNGMKYYGKSCSEKDTEEAIEFGESLIKKLLKIRKSLINPEDKDQNTQKVRKTPEDFKNLAKFGRKFAKKEDIKKKDVLKDD